MCKGRFRRLIGLAAVLSLFSCAAVPGGKDARARGALPSPADYPDSLLSYYYHSEGLKAYSVHGDDKGALEYYMKAIAADSLYAPAYFEAAGVFLMGDDPAQAVAYSKTANRLDSTNLFYKSQLGQAMVVSGRYDDALRIYSQLLNEDPHNPVNYRLLAALYDYKDQPFSAISVLDTAEYRLGRDESISSYKRELLMRVRLYDKAVEESEALIAEYPYNDENYVILGNLYAAMGKDSLAVANYRQAMRIDSTSTPTLMSVADFYRARKDDVKYLRTVKRIFDADNMPMDSKIQMFEDITSNIDFYRANYFAINSLAMTLLVRYPSEYSILELYATHLIRSGDLEQALNLYKTYVGINPDEKEVYFTILDGESYLQRADSVAKYSDIAIERFPRDPNLYVRKGYSMMTLNNYRESHRAFDKAYRYSRTDSARSVVRGIVGDLYYRESKPSQAYREYDRALRLDPANAGILNNYAYYLGEEGKRLEKALGMSSRANEADPGNSTYLDTQAWILYKLGRYEEAKKYMQQAVSLDTTGSEVLLLHYGDILYELGDHFMAKVYWRRALERGCDPDQIEKRFNLPEKR